MTLTGTWANTRTGALALTRAGGGAPVRHRRIPPNPGISERRAP